MDTLEGIVMFAQESRFQLLDRNGVAHLFVLSRNAPAEPQQLPALQRKQARVRVQYRPAADQIAHEAVTIGILEH